MVQLEKKRFLTKRNKIIYKEMNQKIVNKTVKSKSIVNEKPWEAKKVKTSLSLEKYKTIRMRIYFKN